MATDNATAGPSRVSYIWSEELQHVADQLPSNIGRSTIVHDLAKSLDLLHFDKGLTPNANKDESNGDFSSRSNVEEGVRSSIARVVEPDLDTFGTREQLERYHDKKYVGPSASRLRDWGIGADAR